MGKIGIHPMSQIPPTTMKEGGGFWLFLLKEDRAIACISSYTFYLADGGFAEYLDALACSCYPREKSPIISVAHPLIEEVSGRMIYFGGIEFAENERGSNRLLCDFAQLAKLLAAKSWSFEWMYTIIAYKHRRLADDYGFHWRVRNAIEWCNPVPDGLANDQMVLATNKLHFDHVLRVIQPGQL